jgi:hypothetical protein
LPGNLNLFQFSVPYLAEKVLDMYYSIIKKGSECKEDDDGITIDEIQKMFAGNTSD